MRAIFFKELRENAKWALVIFGVFSAVIYLGEIREARPNFFFHLLDPGVTMIPFAVAGLLMGLAQTLFEMRADNWSFVVHRPVSRAAMFMAKSAAGLLLLYAALGAPCALAIAWGARPGALAFPFQWRMVLPLIADVLNAGPFYFVGMVITLRKARWFGTRLLPLGLAIGSTLAVRFAPEFWQALVFEVAAMAIGALAAWNVFSSAGTADLSGVSSLALGTMIFAGALGIGCFLVGILGVFQTKTVWHDLRVDRDGNVLNITWTLEGRERTCSVTDAEGHSLPEYEGIDIDDRPDDVPDRFARFSIGLVDESRIQIPWLYVAESFGYRTPTPGVISLRTVAKPGNRLRRSCYFDVPKRLIDIYDPVTRILLGTVGPAGFTEDDQPPSEVFPGWPQNAMAQGNTHTLSFPSEVYWLELDQHRVRKIFTAEHDDPVVAAIEIGKQADPTAVIVTRDHLHVLRPSGEKLFTAVHNLDLSQRWFNLALLPGNQHVVLQSGLIAAGIPGEQFLEFDTAGKLVRQTQPAPYVDDRPPTRLRRTAMMGVIYPLGGLPLFKPWLMDEAFELDSRDHWGLLIRFMLASGAVSGIVTFFLSRRCGFSTAKTAGWTAANVLLGPAGMIVMLGLNEWPARERCASCGGKRLVGRRECPYCGAMLEPPTIDGREIFEPADVFQSAA
jgi:hypothetical protein